MDVPERKPNRLKEYDYSQNGAYFITICTKDKRQIFWSNTAVNDTFSREKVQLSSAGVVVKTAITNISVVYPNVKVDKYVIMPDHIHLILQITTDDLSGRTLCAPTVSRAPMVSRAPTVSRVIKHMKEYVSKRIGFSIWQRSFYDHVIRNEQDYLETWEYIDSNPLRRAEEKNI